MAARVAHAPWLQHSCTHSSGCAHAQPHGMFRISFHASYPIRRAHPEDLKFGASQHSREPDLSRQTVSSVGKRIAVPVWVLSINAAHNAHAKKQDHLAQSQKPIGCAQMIGANTCDETITMASSSRAPRPNRAHRQTQDPSHLQGRLAIQ